MHPQIRIGLGFCSGRFARYRRFKTPGRAFNDMRRRCLEGDIGGAADLRYFLQSLRQPFIDPYITFYECSDDIWIVEMAGLLNWQMVRPYVNARLADYPRLSGTDRKLSVRV